MRMSLMEQVAPGFLDPALSSLVRELAQDIREVQDILADYGFSGPADPKWTALSETVDFHRALQDAVREWNAVDSTPKRIRHKSQASLEIVIADLHVIARTDRNTATRLDAIRVIKSLAGFDHNGGAGGANVIDPGSGGFSITINVGDKSTLVNVKTIEGVADSDTTENPG